MTDISAVSSAALTR